VEIHRSARRHGVTDHEIRHATDHPLVVVDLDPKTKTYKTKTGKVLTDADIEALADEAERGYDVDALKSRRRGPTGAALGPSRGLGLPSPGNRRHYQHSADAYLWSSGMARCGQTVQ